jgi:hypothetical protein
MSRPGLVTALVVLVPTIGVAQAAPKIAGISLGDRARTVTQVLGRPAGREQSLGMAFWSYPDRGLTVIWREEDTGVHGIVVSRAEAGPVGGVRVGDADTAARDFWGLPARIRLDGRFLDYVGNGWVISVEVRDHTIVEITLLAAS